MDESVSVLSGASAAQDDAQSISYYDNFLAFINPDDAVRFQVPTPTVEITAEQSAMDAQEPNPPDELVE